MVNRNYDNMRRDLALNLRRIRKGAGLSQEQLSMRAQVDRSYVSQIEREVGNPSLHVLASLAGTLNSDVVDLLSANILNIKFPVAE